MTLPESREQAAEALSRANGRTGWIISDGKAGNEAQCVGVFEALALDYQFKRVDPKGLWKKLAPWGPVDPAERFGSPGRQFAAPWPDFAIAAGRLAIPYIRKLKRAAGPATYTVILMDPKVSSGTADLFWVPEHDKRRGPNVLTTLTSPHRFTPRRLAELRARMPPAISALPSPRVAVLLGGPNGDYRFPPEVVAHLITALQSMLALGAGLMITPSRRTPPELAASVRQATGRAANALFWNGEGESPYPQFLAHADAFVVTADSINMAGETCATGKPVHIFEPEGGSAKFARFHDTLRWYGATRPLPERFERLETWSYTPLSSAETIASEIACRWTRRRLMLGSLAEGSR